MTDTRALRDLLDSYVEDMNEPGWCCQKHTPQPDDVRALLAEIDALRRVADAADVLLAIDPRRVDFTGDYADCFYCHDPRGGHRPGCEWDRLNTYAKEVQP